MREVYYPGDYVKFSSSFGGDVDYGTVLRMGTHSNPYDPNQVLVVWDSDGNTLHAELNIVSLVRRAAEQKAFIERTLGEQEKEFNKTSDKMSVADLKKFLEKLDDSMYVSGIHSLSFHFGQDNFKSVRFRE